MKRALVVCPGRGSYDRSSLGQLQDRGEAATAVIDACDGYRRAHGRDTLRDLDAADAFRVGRHVAGEHASLLTFACGMADLADLNQDEFEIVGVAGNSMGFYTALAASGALSLADAIALVDTMGSYQASNVIGGQLLTPVCDDEWAIDAAREERVDAAISSVRAAGGQAWWSIRLGGFAVLGADEAGLKLLMTTLPKEERGSRTFPVRLPTHSAFHTPLMAQTSSRAKLDLADLHFRAPGVPLIDGRGTVFRPHWANPEALRAYTLGYQVTDPYNFTYSLQTALRHCAPDVVAVLGPGNSLGGPIARILLEEGWRGIQRREDFDIFQREDPMLLCFGVRVQRPVLT
jgi:[acyl-carrier-protein] S-malonyltransferase